MSDIKKPRTKADYKAAPKPAAKKAPWDKDNPKKSKESKASMTDAQKAEAKARAEKAGRPYPNLVDNMAVMKAARKKGE